jgi:hypothetical protein
LAHAHALREIRGVRAAMAQIKKLGWIGAQARAISAATNAAIIRAKAARRSDGGMLPFWKRQTRRE